jgi:hypothetical protein
VRYDVLPTDEPLAAREGRPTRSQSAEALVEVWSDQIPRGGNAWKVEEVLHWDDPRPADETQPGGSDWVLFYFLRRRRDLTQQEFRRRYCEGHAPLARVHHPGIRRYVQNFVVEAGEGAPECHAVAQLHFAGESDLRARFYRDASSPSVIATDVARFMDLASGRVLVTRAGPMQGPPA